MAQGTIFKIKKYALHDGPGIRTTVFLKGCPLSCRWCHNPESIHPDPQPMERPAGSFGGPETMGREVSTAEIMAEVEKDRLFYDESGGGVTFSGGEPLMQPDFLHSLLAECRERELHAALDTSGFAPPETLERVLPLVDLLLFDLKLMNEALHRKHTGRSNTRILTNLKIAAMSGRELRIRVPLIPGITDTDDNTAQTAAFIASLGADACVDLLPWHRIAEEKYNRLGMENRMGKTPPLSGERVESIRKRFTLSGLRTTIGG